jgi:hypothetical protein
MVVSHFCVTVILRHAAVWYAALAGRNLAFSAKRPNIRVFDQDGHIVSLEKLRRLADKEGVQSKPAALDHAPKLIAGNKRGLIVVSLTS